MPIVPRFKISQDDEFVYIRINVPYIKVSEAEMIADGCDFSFYCKPYLLKLTFPHSFDGDDEERCRAKYDPSDENGVITGHLPKSIKGQHFEGLDMITTLLQKRIQKDVVPGISPPLIEVLDSSETNDESDDLEDFSKDHMTSDSILSHISITKPKYGFNQSYSNILGALMEDSVFELTENPDKTSLYRRRELRLAKERQLFSGERYTADYFGGSLDSLYPEMMNYEPFWISSWNQRSNASTTQAPQDNETKLMVNSISNLSSSERAAEGDYFTEIEQQTMMNLPHKEYLIQKGSIEEGSIFMNMIDILFSFCYDYRFNCGEMTVESPESITKLSASLSYLDAFSPDRDSYLDLIVSCCRRSIIYPYFRIWKCARKVLADVAKILFLGRRCLLKCFLQLHFIFEHTEQFYILNKLYITDYCVWIQTTMSDEELLRIATLFNNAKRDLESRDDHGKGLTDLNLKELEEMEDSDMDSDS